ncbi:MAG: hypothetical protein ACRECH_08430, partial [Nitrososphaerales archaeon]
CSNQYDFHTAQIKGFRQINLPLIFAWARGNNLILPGKRTLIILKPYCPNSRITNRYFRVKK